MTFRQKGRPSSRSSQCAIGSRASGNLITHHEGGLSMCIANRWHKHHAQRANSDALFSTLKKEVQIDKWNKPYAIRQQLLSMDGCTCTGTLYCRAAAPSSATCGANLETCTCRPVIVSRTILIWVSSPAVRRRRSAQRGSERERAREREGGREREEDHHCAACGGAGRGKRATETPFP